MGRGFMGGFMASQMNSTFEPEALRVVSKLVAPGVGIVFYKPGSDDLHLTGSRCSSVPLQGYPTHPD